jgi:phenylpyruvate tautomerase PptA (4-oxalocrotonate tautomerase family)
MPLTMIDVIRGRSDSEVQTLMDSIHAAMVEAFEVPDTDRYQILTQHEPHEMIARDTGLGMERTRDLVMVQFVSRQRAEKAKQQLYRLLAANLQADCGIDPEDLIVTITENGAADWSFGRGVAQFLTDDL